MPSVFGNRALDCYDEDQRTQRVLKRKTGQEIREEERAGPPTLEEVMVDLVARSQRTLTTRFEEYKTRRREMQPRVSQVEDRSGSVELARIRLDSNNNNNNIDNNNIADADSRSFLQERAGRPQPERKHLPVTETTRPPLRSPRAPGSPGRKVLPPVPRLNLTQIRRADFEAGGTLSSTLRYHQKVPGDVLDALVHSARVASGVWTSRGHGQSSATADLEHLEHNQFKNSLATRLSHRTHEMLNQMYRSGKISPRKREVDFVTVGLRTARNPEVGKDFFIQMDARLATNYIFGVIQEIDRSSERVTVQLWARGTNRYDFQRSLMSFPASAVRKQMHPGTFEKHVKTPFMQAFSAEKLFEVTKDRLDAETIRNEGRNKHLPKRSSGLSLVLRQDRLTRSNRNIKSVQQTATSSQPPSTARTTPSAWQHHEAMPAETYH